MKKLVYTLVFISTLFLVSVSCTKQELGYEEQLTEPKDSTNSNRTKLSRPDNSEG